MHVRKVSSQISLCSPHKLIMDDTFHFWSGFMHVREVLSEISLCSQHRLNKEDTLGLYVVVFLKEISS